MPHASRLLAAAAVSASAMLAAAPASALTIVKAFTAPAGPYSLANPNGTIAAIKITKPNTYNFTFTTSGRFDVLMQMQASMFRPAQPQLLAFSLYRGVPGSGVLVTTSGPPITGPAIEMILNAGKYYLQVAPANIAKNNELLTGGLTITGVPEPATWAMMITGFGLLGLAARRRRAMAGQAAG
jgi:hypothetical protein